MFSCCFPLVLVHTLSKLKNSYFIGTFNGLFRMPVGLSRHNCTARYLLSAGHFINGLEIGIEI